ncbi:MAG: PepSY domain-containing protein [Nostoc sp.]|uniref:PepSY domain-containing protein n=1 Tax=Nostoc sp. TaxID=1180 RepID=UPI002FF9488B
MEKNRTTDSRIKAIAEAYSLGSDRPPLLTEQAQQVVEASVAGKASSVKLENEDGNLVYAVKIGQQNVKVDAGNGKVLYAENANQQDDKNEATRLTSSIQVQETSDGDRQTNDDSK